MYYYASICICVEYNNLTLTLNIFFIKFLHITLHLQKRLSHLLECLRIEFDDINLFLKYIESSR